MTASSATLVNNAIFLKCSLGSGISDLQTSASGCIPIARSSLTECCVGFVLISADALI